MPLKMVVDTLEGLPEGVASLYEEKDGKYHLPVEGAVPKTKLDEFRNTNINVTKELTALKSLFGDDVDPKAVLEEYKALKEEKESAGHKKLLEEGQVDEVVAQKTEKMRKDYESKIGAGSKRIAELENELASTKNKLAEILIDSNVTQAVNGLGDAVPGAIKDILSRAREVWHLEDNQPVPRKGDQLLYGKDGQTLLTIEEWVEDLMKEAPHLFKSSSGAGSQGSGGSGPGRGNIDYSKIPAADRLKVLRRNQRKR